MNSTVLVIEDNQANLELARYLLEAAGHAVLTASDGQQGVEIMRREHPALVVCDLQMPVLDGYGVLRQLRNDPALAMTPIVAVTAFSMPDDRRNILSAGFDGYISKPIDPESFVSELERLLPPGDLAPSTSQ